MDRQKVFNKVVDHLLTQNAASMNSNGDCLYRGENGMMCAIGCLIEDRHYKASIEKHGIVFSEVITALQNSGVNLNSGRNELLLDYLQHIHDTVKVENWSWALMLLAEDEGLEFNYKG